MTASYIPDCGVTGAGFDGSSTHTHDEYLTAPEGDLLYSLLGHTHTGYALAAHTHPYSPEPHTHSQYLTLASGDARYAAIVHNHDAAYLDKAEGDAYYALITHDHTIYALTSHTHAQYMDVTTGDARYLSQSEGDSFYAALVHFHDASEVGLPPHVHDQYLDQAEGDALYLTQAQGDTRYYTQTAADAKFLTSASGDALFLTPAEGDARYITLATGDARYLTPTSGDALFLTPAEGDARYYTQSASDTRYYTKTQADLNFLDQTEADARYYTKPQADTAFLTQAEGDARYYTQAQIDAAAYVKQDGSTPITATQVIRGDVNMDTTGYGFGQSFYGARVRAVTPGSWARGLLLYKAGTGSAPTDAIGFSGFYGTTGTALDDYRIGIDAGNWWAVFDPNLTQFKATTLSQLGQAFNLGGSGITTQDTYANLGQARTGNGYAYLDLIGDTTYSDYGLRIMRGNAGANAVSMIRHRGTGHVQFYCDEAAAFRFYSAAAEKFTILSNGNVGIGTTAPGYPLEVTGNAVAGVLYADPGGLGTGHRFTGVSNTSFYGSSIYVGIGAASGDSVFYSALNATDSFVALGKGNTNSRASSYDLMANGAAPTSPDARFYRYAGVDGNCSLINNGNGLLTIQNTGTGNIRVNAKALLALEISRRESTSAGSIGGVRYGGTAFAVGQTEAQGYAGTGIGGVFLMGAAGQTVNSTDPQRTGGLVYISRNTSVSNGGGTLTAPPILAMDMPTSEAGASSPRYMWVKSTGQLVISNLWPTMFATASGSDLIGTVIGPASSSARFKRLLPSVRDAAQKRDEALAALRAVEQFILPFQFTAYGPPDELFDGIVLDEAHPETHRYGMEKHSGEFPEGDTLNLPNLFGDLIKAICHLDARLLALEGAAVKPVKPA